MAILGEGISADLDCELVSSGTERTAWRRQMTEFESRNEEKSDRLQALSVGDPHSTRTWAEAQLLKLGDASRIAAEASGFYALLGLCAFWVGDFVAVDEYFDLTVKLVGRRPWSDDVASRMSLQSSLSGAVASLRGESERAETLFASALDVAGGRVVDQSRAIAFAMRAAFAGEGRPERALADVSQARTIAGDLGGPELVTVASIGEGWARSEIGQYDEAIKVLRHVTDARPDTLEGSVARLRLSEVLLRTGNRNVARKEVDIAREIFLALNARYWAARAVLLTGAIDRDRGGRWLKHARQLALPDPAYQRLFLPEGVLRIELSASPAVRRDGEPIDFLTRHAEATVRSLAAAGDDGVSSEDLVGMFWPTMSKVRQHASLRTVLWQARNSLGADAWRLQRRGDVVVFDVSGVELVGTIKQSTIVKEFPPRRRS